MVYETDQAAPCINAVQRLGLREDCLWFSGYEIARKPNKRLFSSNKWSVGSPSLL